MPPSPGFLVLMRLRRRHLRDIISGLVTGIMVMSWTSLAAEDDLELPDLEKPSQWIRSYEARGWSGYKDNVLLGNHNTVESALLGVGADVAFFRMPANNWEASLFGSGEYTRYLTARVVDDEAIIILQGQAKRSFGQGWKAGGALEYLYFNQVFDGSTFADVLVPVPIQGNSVTVRPMFSRDLGKSSRLELELPATRQQFDEFIDNFWEAGPKLSWVKPLAAGSEFSLAYQFGMRLHDTREARDEQGIFERGRGLVFYIHEVTAVWRQYWDDARRWRTTTKVGALRNDDNGGYYQYWRPQIAEQLRYQAKTWEMRLDARVSYYTYDHERVAGGDSEFREKTYLRLGLRGEKTLTKSLKLFGQYEHERALSNLEFDRYAVNTISMGVHWEF